MPKSFLVLLITGSLAATLPLSAEEPPLSWRQLFQPGDRILWLGDENTQQSTYSRAAAGALLMLLPRHKLIFFNGGYEGATTASASEWLEELLKLTEPSIVFVNFGLNDAWSPPPNQDPVQAYRDNLGRLLDRLTGFSGIRQVIVLGPAATQPGLNPQLDALRFNDLLQKFSEAASQTARQRSLPFIDLFAHSRFVFEAASKTEGEPLSFDGRIFNELGGVVVASIILKGLGVAPADLEPLAWAPLPARKMARIRSGLAIPLTAPSLEAAQPSRQLYEDLRHCDELFFRAWRLADKSPSAPSRASAMAAVQRAWLQIHLSLQGSPEPSPLP